MRLTVESISEAQTIDAARRLAGELRGGEVVALEGQLGAGKTCFVRGLAEGLGLDGAIVSSPTFVIAQEYEIRESRRAGEGGISTLVHVDAYRLQDTDDLQSIGWDELRRAPDVVIAVEWPSRIRPAIPEDAYIVELSHAGATQRSIVIRRTSA